MDVSVGATQCRDSINSCFDLDKLAFCDRQSDSSCGACLGFEDAINGKKVYCIAPVHEEACPDNIEISNGKLVIPVEFNYCPVDRSNVWIYILPLVLLLVLALALTWYVYTRRKKEHGDREVLEEEEEEPSSRVCEPDNTMIERKLPIMISSENATARESEPDEKARPSKTSTFGFSSLVQSISTFKFSENFSRMSSMESNESNESSEVSLVSIQTHSDGDRSSMFTNSYSTSRRF